MLAHRIDESGCGYWRTPAQQEPGIDVNRLEPIEGGELGGMNRHFDKETGRMAQIGLTQQVAAREMWPTPNTMDSLKPKSEEHLLREATEIRPGRTQPQNLRDCVSSKHLWPTPRSIYGEHPGMKEPSHLTGAVQMWPTPEALNQEGYQVSGGKRWPRLGAAVNESPGGTPTRQKWMTPKCPSGGPCDRTTPGGGLRKLEDQVAGKKNWATPDTQNYRDGEKKRKAAYGDHAMSLHHQVPGQLNPDFVEWLMGWGLHLTSTEPMISYQLIGYKKQLEERDNENKTRPGKILQALREAYVQEAHREELPIRRHEDIRGAGPLRPEMHGPGDDKRGEDKGCLVTPCPPLQEKELRGLRYVRPLTNSPYRQGFNKQFIRELDDAVHSLSHEMALEEWEEKSEGTFGLYNMWSACQRSGFLSKAFGTLQEVWRSLNDEEKGWVAYLCVNPGGWWDLECPSVPRIAKGIKDRVSRLKAIGNGQVPLQMVAAWHLLKGKIDEDD